MKRIIDDLLKTNVIRPSNSPYSSPIVLVKKKSGATRLCVDYRQLNKLTVRDHYPIPLIDDHLDMLRGKRVFSSIDLKSGFHHVHMDEGSVKYTSFVTPFGQYEYLRMPFGLCNSPSVFQRFINTIFRRLIDVQKVLVYLDDILTATESVDENLAILEDVLQVISKYNLELRLDKCSFLQSSIEYLGLYL